MLQMLLAKRKSLTSQRGFKSASHCQPTSNTASQWSGSTVFPKTKGCHLIKTIWTT